MMRALAATGVLRGFNTQAEGSVLSIGPGLAYHEGEEILGGWQLDFAGQRDGWTFAQAGGLTLYAVLLSAGRIAALRDLRQFIAVVVCYGPSTVMLQLGAPSLVLRLVTALRLQNGAKGALLWHPLPGSHAQLEIVDEACKLTVRAMHGQQVAVVVEYVWLQ
jgi:hypothetical protein